MAMAATTDVPATTPASSPLQPDPQPVEFAARQAELARRPGAVPRVYFVSRPDRGLWGVTCGEKPDARSAATAQAMADALHDVSAAGSLSALVEEVRRTLTAVRARAVSSVGAAVFLTRADECAVVYVGSAQAFRVRSALAEMIAGIAAPSVAAADASLLDLLTGGSDATSDPVVVHYDTLSRDDVWLLAGARLFDPQEVTTLSALLAQQVDDTTAGAIQRQCGPRSGFDADELPLLVLAAAPGSSANSR
jgi:hypothetical protein